MIHSHQLSGMRLLCSRLNPEAFLFVRLLTSYSNWILTLPAENDFGPIVFCSLPSASDRGLNMWPCFS